MVTVKGNLKLNERENGHVIFIPEEASLKYPP